MRINICLGCDDVHYFRDIHYKDDNDNAVSLLRLLHYPPVKSDAKVDIRCGEHTDYGTITYLLQEKAGGLQVSGQIAVIVIFGSAIFSQL